MCFDDMLAKSGISFFDKQQQDDTSYDIENNIFSSLSDMIHLFERDCSEISRY